VKFTAEMMPFSPSLTTDIFKDGKREARKGFVREEGRNVPDVKGKKLLVVGETNEKVRDVTPNETSLRRKTKEVCDAKKEVPDR